MKFIFMTFFIFLELVANARSLNSSDLSRNQREEESSTTHVEIDVADRNNGDKGSLEMVKKCAEMAKREDKDTKEDYLDYFIQGMEISQIFVTNKIPMLNIKKRNTENTLYKAGYELGDTPFVVDCDIKNNQLYFDFAYGSQTSSFEGEYNDPNCHKYYPIRVTYKKTEDKKWYFKEIAYIGNSIDHPNFNKSACHK